jgi:ATP-binding cassette subfamily B protein
VAKLASVAVPLVLKDIVDALDKPRALLAVPLFLLMAYGALRLANSLFGDLRDVVFAKVMQRSIRRVALKVFRHLHSLALRFHLDRQTGGISRDIERGTAGIRFMLTFAVFNILPTLLEIGLVVGILLAKFDASFAVITFGTLVAYVFFTFLVTEWRMKFRRAMNEMDSKANTSAIDSLLNYETVKYFNNEDYEARRYDTILMVLASNGVVQGALTLGDLVMVNAFLIQLYMPMRFLGTVYREIRHALADMEKMFGLLQMRPEVDDKPHAKGRLVQRGHIRFEHVDFAYEPDRQILFDVDFEIPANHKVAVVGHSGVGKSTLARLIFRNPRWHV